MKCSRQTNSSAAKPGSDLPKTFAKRLIKTPHWASISAGMPLFCELKILPISLQNNFSDSSDLLI